MSRLPVPIREILKQPHDEVALARMRAEVLRRRSLRDRPTARWRAPLPRIAAGVLAVAALVALGVAMRPEARGPLRLADGAALDGTFSVVEPIALEDGSTLSSPSEGRLEVLANEPERMLLLLSQGTVTFDVEPGGPRRWTIECGMVSVEVVGTRFTLSRDEGHVAVAVEHGRVLVRGERVPDHVARLGAGERLEVHAETAAPVVVEEPAPSALPIDEPPIEPAAAEHTGRASSTSAPTRATWRDLARDSRWNEAWSALPESMTTLTARAQVDELLALADVARLSGHPAEAVAPLTRLVEEHPNDPNAGLAAFSLGRVEETLHHPARAAMAYARAESLGLPEDLIGDVLARRASALERAASHAEAEAVAQRYLDRIPDGPRAAEMREIVSH